MKKLWEENKGIFVAALAMICLAIFATIIIRFFSTSNSVGKFYHAPSSDIIGEIIKRGYFDCFDSSMSSNERCNPSAVVYNREYLIVGNDRRLEVAETSPVLKYSLTDELMIDSSSRSYMMQAPLVNLDKIESMAIDQYRRLILIATAFDREKPDDWDSFNSLVLVTDQNFAEAKLVLQTDRAGKKSSLKLKELIRGALRSKEFPNGAPYFKIEGLTFLPGNKILFGIREIGENYKNFNYAHILIEAEYLITNKIMNLSNFKLVYDFSLRSRAQVNQNIGISSLDYDFTSDRLYLVSSFEESEKKDEGLGGYIWYMSLNDLYSNKLPKILTDENDEIIRLAHKPEGLTILDPDTLLVIHDDDAELGRELNQITTPATQFSRKFNQAAFTILKVRSKTKK